MGMSLIFIFILKDCASRLVSKNGQRQLERGLLGANVRLIIAMGDTFFSKYRTLIFSPEFLFFFQWSKRENPVPCQSKSSHVVTVCPYNSTCCKEMYSVTGQGCCLTPDAVTCGDDEHCCPAGYECDPACKGYECSCQKTR